MKLKVREIEVEGTPEELRTAGYASLLLGHFDEPPRPTTPTAEAHGDSARFSSEIERFLDMRVPSNVRDTAEAIIREVLSWASVYAVVGPGIPGGRYLRFHRRGAAVGAFLYLNPKRAILRLPGDAASGMEYAVARAVVETNPHQVGVRLDEPEALEEVLALTRRAYDDAQ